MALGIIYDDVTDSSGNAIANIDVTIYIAGTVTKASLFDASEGGSPISNPVQTNDQGVFSAYVAAGDYDVSVDAPGGTVVRPNVTVADGDDIADLLSVRELGAITSADKVTYDGESATVDAALDARVPTVSTLAAFQSDYTSASFSDGQFIELKGRSSVGDGGAGKFRVHTTDKSAEVAADEVGAGLGNGGVWIAFGDALTGASGAIERQSEVITPAMYGAFGGGTADETDELQAYFDSTFDGLKTARKGAEYKITSVTISTSQVIDFNLAKITCDASNTNKLVIISGTDVSLSRAVFDHKNTAFIGASLEVSGSRVTVSECEFNDICEYSLVVHSAATDVDVLYNKFDKTDQTSFNIVCQGTRINIIGNRVFNGDAGVVVNGTPSDILVSNNFIADVAETGVDVIGAVSENVVIANNVIKTCPLGGVRVGTSGSGGFYGEKVIVSGNRIIDCGSGGAHSIDITGDGTEDPSVLVTGNHISGHSASASCIIITAAPRSVISNNYCNGGDYGVFINEGSRNSAVVSNKLFLNRIDGVRVKMAVASPFFNGNVSNNIIFSNGTTNDGTGVNVVLGIGTSVVSNLIHEPLTTGKKQQNGIRFQPNASKCSVQENTIYGNDTPILIDSGSTSGYVIGNNYDSAGNNITRAKGNTSIPNGSSSASVTYNLVLTPTNYQMSADTSDLIWVSSKGASGATFSRSGTTGAATVYYDITI